MAFSSRAPGERPKSLIFRNPVSQPDEYVNHRNTPLSPMRSVSQSSASDARNSLQRRFTTNALPSLAPIGEQHRQQDEGEPQSAYSRMSATEKKARQYEALLAQQRRIQAQMAMIDPETRREVDEARKLEQDISFFTSGGALGDPDTPPADGNPATFQQSTVYNNRYSTSSITSPQFNPNRQSRTGSQLTSPPPEFVNSYFGNQTHPSQSVPGSQRNSDQEESDDDYNFTYATVRPKAGANPNRNSMPVTAFDLRSHNHALSNFSPVLGPVNGSHFQEEDGRKSKRSSQILATSPDSKTFLALHQTDDKFPILVRRGTDTGHFSGSVTPLEVPEENDRTDRLVAARHRQSLPPSSIRHSQIFDNMSGLDSVLSDATAKNTAANRRSLEVKFSGLGESRRPALLVSPQKNGFNGLSKVASSYSTNDIPTLKSINNTSTHDSKQASAVHTPAEEIISPIQNIMAGNAANYSKPLPPGPPVDRDADALFRNPYSRFQPGQQGYKAEATGNNYDAVGGAVAQPAQAFPGGPQYNHNHQMSALTSSMGGMNMGTNHGHWQAQAGAYQPGAFGGWQNAAPPGGRYEQGRPAQGRRGTNQSEAARINNLPLEELAGEIYGLCKDQHGCRFLQKKLEERDAKNTAIIYDETLPHVVELMTDPFGNYLCQKLLEYGSDEQRTNMMRAASKYMVKIALNQHGTRALQKMIEFITTQEQIDVVIQSLTNEVVQLIQDLNGNHVIQKCLNHLKKDNIQFIIDAVCVHVVTVGTHRHGCCVLQRCVDHASGLQKGQIVLAITQNVFALVQDPFGNYVVQYILDLGEPNFSEPICRSLVGQVAPLACQKFSSNVMEKSIRVAKEDTRRILVQEMLRGENLQRMLRDSFANYVVQTAMDYSDPETKAAMFEQVRIIMPNIRHTPHGRRILTKIQEYDGENEQKSVFPRALSAGADQRQGPPAVFGAPPPAMGRMPYAQAQYGAVAPGAAAPYGYPNGTSINHAGAVFGQPNALNQRYPVYQNMGRNAQYNMNQF